MSVGVGLSTRFEYEFISNKKSIVEEKKKKAYQIALEKENLSPRDISKLARKLTEETYKELLAKMQQLHPGEEYIDLTKIHYNYDYQFKSSENQKEFETVIKSALSSSSDKTK